MAGEPISVLEVAQSLGVSRGQVAKYLKRGAIRGAFKIGKAWAIPVPVTVLMLPDSRPRPRRGKVNRDSLGAFLPLSECGDCG